jgi:zinc transport system substrate-binding protein
LLSDVEAQSGHDHAHGHNDKKSANCTSDHGHSDVSHEKPSESSSLFKGAQKAGYSKIAEHDDHDGHSHGHASKVAHNGHDHASGNHHDDHDDDHHDDHHSGPEKMDANIQVSTPKKLNSIV